MSNQAALAVAKEFIDLIYHQPQDISIEYDVSGFSQVIPSTTAWLYLKNVFGELGLPIVFNREQLVQLILSRKFPFHNRGAVIAARSMLQIWADFEEKAQQRQGLSSLDGKKTDSRMDYFEKAGKLSMRWNDIIRNSEEVVRFGNEEVWCRQWKPLFYVQTAQGRREKSWTIWFMGLPGSGKTTLATSFFFYLSGQYNDDQQIVMIDGDMTRTPDTILVPGTGIHVRVRQKDPKYTFYRASRMERAGELNSFLQQLDWNGRTVIVGSAFLPYQEQRAAIFSQFRDRVLLVYVNPPIEVCQERCRSRGYRGDVYDDPHNEPGIVEFEQPDETLDGISVMTVDTSVEPLYRSIERIILTLNQKEWAWWIRKIKRGQ